MKRIIFPILLNVWSIRKEILILQYSIWKIIALKRNATKTPGHKIPPKASEFKLSFGELWCFGGENAKLLIATKTPRHKIPPKAYKFNLSFGEFWCFRALVAIIYRSRKKQKEKHPNIRTSEQLNTERPYWNMERGTWHLFKHPNIGTIEQLNAERPHWNVAPGTFTPSPYSSPCAI
mgnify:CR=1 FL=1